MKLLIVLGTIAAALGMSAAQLLTCTTYNGDQCTSVFSTANITRPVTSISVGDASIVGYFAALGRLSISQSCQNYLRILQCLTVYPPCTGSAWCGSMSPTELMTAVNNTCGCTATSCSFPVPTEINYYQGSSSGGRVSNNMLTCQDVTLATGSSAGTIKMSMMGAVLVAILLSIGLLL